MYVIVSPITNKGQRYVLRRRNEIDNKIPNSSLLLVSVIMHDSVDRLKRLLYRQSCPSFVITLEKGNKFGYKIHTTSPRFSEI